MRHLMVLGTQSGVGKHTLATGLLRLLRRHGASCAPFKAIAIEHHGCLLPDGRIMAFSQAIQAMAAGLPPSAIQNPYLSLYTNEGFTLVELGEKLAENARPNMITNKDHFTNTIRDAFLQLQQSVDHIILEGAGCPAELGLESIDLANIFPARLSQADIILVADMEHGGGYASAYGTAMLLPEDIRKQLRCIVLNKLYQDTHPEFIRAGTQKLTQLLGVPVMVLPFLENLNIPEENLYYGISSSVLGHYSEEFDMLADHIQNHLDTSILLDGMINFTTS